MTAQPSTKVLIVDDSAVVRSVLTRIVEETPGLEVAGTAMNAKIARDKILALDPDVVTLDVEMPEISGIQLLEKIMEGHPLPVIMCSTLTSAGADTALQALDLGAFDVIGKPSATLAGSGLDQFREELQEKLRAAGAARRRLRHRYAPPKTNGNGNGHTATALPPRPATPAPKPALPAGQRLRLTGPCKRHIVAIGASTGGTEALRDVLTRLPADIPGTVIVQHMPEAFTAAFASRLNGICAMEVKEAANGDEVRPGRVLIAPGNFHMTFAARGGSFRVEINQDERVNHHRPSVEVLFDSITKVGGAAVDTVAVMLTGMGKDGSEAMLRLKRAGALTICQDQESSVVWGMPGEAVKIGAADRVAAVTRIPELMIDFICRGDRG